MERDVNNVCIARRSVHRGVAWAMTLALLLGVALDARGQTEEDLPQQCGTIRNSYGPFDYRTATKDEKDLVEYAHFYREYGAYLKGSWTVDIGNQVGNHVAAGLDYTLRAFPNHHRALKAMDDMAIRRKMDKLPGAFYNTQCYFLRAVIFTPNDGLVRALYGGFYARRGKPNEAREQLSLAVQLSPSEMTTRAQVASTYMLLGDWKEAESNARAAYELGYPLPGLRDKLKSQGHWSE
jgi:hypothetical protein